MKVYKVVNEENGKVYIGKTKKTLEDRWKRHLYLAEKGVNRHFYDAINHYGKEKFSIELLEECNTEDELDRREKYWIDQFNSISREKGYNMTEGGEGGDTFSCQSEEKKEEIREKLSKLHSERDRDEETYKKIADAERGQNLKDETKDKISESLEEFWSQKSYEEKIDMLPDEFFVSGEDHPMYGETHTDEVKVRLSEARKGKSYEEIYGEERAKKMKKKVSRSGKENGRYIHIPKEEIIKCIKEGYTQKEIADKFDTRRQTVLKRVKEYWNITFSELKNKL